MRAGLDRFRGRPDLWALAGLVVAGAGLRVWTAVVWQPALLGYSDTVDYLDVASQGSLFADPYHPAGYPLFLRGMHRLTTHLAVVAGVQHLLGIVTALLLWAAVRRVGAPPWPALLAAAVPLLFGTGILAEHAIITEWLFGLLEALALYGWARTVTTERGWVWAGVAGVAVAAATTVREVGLSLVPVLCVAMALAPRSWRRRLALVAVAGAAACLVVGTYVVAAQQATGHLGITRAASWNLYGRTAPFADCRQFSPPAGASALCQSVPVGRRPGPNDYVHSWAASPALQAFGWPKAAEQRDDDRVAAFARAAILGTPRAYARVVLRDLRRYWDPEHDVRQGYGLSSESLVRDYLLSPTPRPMQRWPDWRDAPGYRIRGVGALASYERATRIQGPLLLVLLLLGVGGVVLAPAVRPRLLALTVLGVALLELVAPVAAYMYDARFALPAFGVLSSAAAIGLGQIAQRLGAIQWGWVRSGAGSVTPRRPG